MLTPANLHSLLLAALLAVLHVAAARLPLLRRETRRAWLSAGAGVSVAFVFMHLLPGLHQHQRNLGVAVEGAPTWKSRLAYLLALGGLAAFYGLERITHRSRRRERESSGRDHTGPAAFWLSIVTFGLYNATVGRMLVERADAGLATLATFAVAIGLHLLVNDYALELHHCGRYRRPGRWILSACVLLGTVMGVAGWIAPAVLSGLAAVLAGGVTLNVLKEELPAGKDSRFGAFLLGVAGYALVMVLLP